MIKAKTGKGERIMRKYRVTVRVPVQKRGLFGRRKTVYEERTVVVDRKTYLKICREEQNRATDDFLDFVDEMETLDAIFDD